jgi:hypothetical protein
MNSIVSHSGPVFERYRAGLVDYVSSLWGQNEIPDTIPAEFEQLSLLEVRES